ncbi:hypothetical protein D3C71_77430 [compost metagenome]
MGTYMKALVGRVKPRPADQPPTPTAVVLTGINGGLPTDFDQFEFEHYDDGVIMQNYQLFAWLAHVRGDFEPVVDTEQLRNATYGFVEWLDHEQQRKEDEEFRALPKEQQVYGFGHGQDPTWSDNHMPYDSGGWVVYPIEALANFNYDQPVKLRRKEKLTDREWGDVVKQYENTTYRYNFGEFWFTFLKWAQDNNWQFAIFSFD